MHSTEAANIHENVKTEPLAAMEGAQQFVIPTAMTHTQVNDLVPLGRAERLHPLADLPVRIMAGGVKQRSCNFNLKRLAFQQIYRLDRRFNGSVRHDLCSGLHQ